MRPAARPANARKPKPVFACDSKIKSRTASPHCNRSRLCGQRERCGASTKRCWLFFRRGDQSFTNSLLTGKLAEAAHRLGLFPRRLLRWLLVEAPPLHFPEHAFPLHLLLQDAKSLIDVVIADEYLHWVGSGCSSSAFGRDVDAREHPARSCPRVIRSKCRCSDRPMPLAAR